MTKIEDELNKLVDSKMTTILANAKRIEVALTQRQLREQHELVNAKRKASKSTVA